MNLVARIWINENLPNSDSDYHLSLTSTSIHTLLKGNKKCLKNCNQMIIIAHIIWIFLKKNHFDVTYDKWNNIVFSIILSSDFSETLNYDRISYSIFLGN